MIRFVVIGITDQPQPFFPPDVLDIIRSGHVFSGGRRHHEIVAHLLPPGAEWIDITVPLDAVFEKYAALACNTPTAPIIVFASGDPLFFGFANTIRRRLPEASVEVYPAFNSLQMLAHRLLMPYHDMRIVSLTGRPWPEFDRALIERTPKLGILTDREHTPAAIARRMLDYGYANYSMAVGEHLGNPELERVSTITLAEAAASDFAQPNCVILTAEQSVATRPFGIPDSDFVLLDNREKMITKMPIRLLTLQALDLPHRHVLWDIGACTGSVSIEARLQFPHLHVVAFEVRPECEAIIHANARRHGTPGIDLHIGDFLELCPPTPSSPPSPVCGDVIATTPATLPAPDAIFIGGHGGRLKEIMATAVHYLRPGGIIVMNSVSSPVVDQATHHRPSSRQLFEEACAELGLRQLPTLSITLNDYNPINILKCELPS